MHYTYIITEAYGLHLQHAIGSSWRRIKEILGGVLQSACSFIACRTETKAKWWVQTREATSKDEAAQMFDPPELKAYICPHVTNHNRCTDG